MKSTLTDNKGLKFHILLSVNNDMSPLKGDTFHAPQLRDCYECNLFISSNRFEWLVIVDRMFSQLWWGVEIQEESGWGNQTDVQLQHTAL